MKKIITIVCAFMMLLFVGCGKDMSSSKYCGTWAGDTASYSGMTFDVSTVFETCELELDSKGKASLNVDGDVHSGKWQETETGVSIDNDDVILTEVDGKLSLEQDGVTITFAKK